jgi:ABC-type uncharacterized transport system permease subunit
METEEHHQQQQLPTYDPLSHVAKKELSRIRSAQKAVHLIPLLVLLCAIILWFFSSPGDELLKQINQYTLVGETGTYPARNPFP